MKGQLEKEDQFALLGYMKGGHMVTPLCPTSKNRFLHPVPVSLPQAAHTSDPSHRC